MLSYTIQCARAEMCPTGAGRRPCRAPVRTMQDGLMRTRAHLSHVFHVEHECSHTDR
jgi:hypothetical protein